MAFTYQSVIDLSRIPLNDLDETRYSDTTLLSFANQGMLQLLKRRPVCSSASLPVCQMGGNVLADAFPLPAGYMQTVADYVTARAEMTDDEHVNSGRAVAFAQLFGAEAQP